MQSPHTESARHRIRRENAVHVEEQSDEEVLETAGALMLRYANGCETADPQVEMNDGVNTRLVSIQPTTNVDALETVATIN